MLEPMMFARPVSRIALNHRVLVWICACLLTVVFTARASTLEDMSFEEIRSEAEANDPYYQAVLAFIYLNGDKGQMISIDQFRDWAEKSSAQAHPLGLFAMGYLGKIEKNLEIHSQNPISFE